MAIAGDDCFLNVADDRAIDVSRTEIHIECVIAKRIIAERSAQEREVEAFGITEGSGSADVIANHRWIEGDRTAKPIADRQGVAQTGDLGTVEIKIPF